MDNNFNQQQMPQNQQMPQQPMYQQMPQQSAYQQAPQQPMYQQAPQQAFQPVPKKPSNRNMLELIAFICAAAGAVMSILGATLTCSCSASKTFSENSEGYSLSAVFILTIFGVLVAAAGVVLAIMALKKNDAAIKAGKLAYVAIAIGTFAVFYGLINTITICGYNCSLQSQAESFGSSMFGY